MGYNIVGPFNPTRNYQIQNLLKYSVEKSYSSRQGDYTQTSNIADYPILHVFYWAILVFTINTC